MYGVYATDNTGNMYLITADLMPADNYMQGMRYSQDEAISIVNHWYKVTGNSAYIAKED